jgi:hypothetical protein
VQRQGALKIAQPKGVKPLPPFEKWSFREIRYVQWLTDMHTVHYALEAAIADATTVATTEHYSKSLVTTCRGHGMGPNRGMHAPSFVQALGMASLMGLDWL